MGLKLGKDFEGFGAVQVSIHFPALDGSDELPSPWMIGQYIVYIVNSIFINEIISLVLGELG